MKHYPIVVEQTDNNFAAFAPDLPGCVATGDTVEEVHRELMAAIDFHIRGMKEDGLAIPEPYSTEHSLV